MSKTLILFTLAAVSLERWNVVNWGAWFWGGVIAANAVNIGLCVLERCFPRTWRMFRREVGMYRDVATRWLMENALNRKHA